MKIKVNFFNKNAYQEAIKKEVEQIANSRNIVSFPTYNLTIDDDVVQTATKNVDKSKFGTIVEYTYLGVAIGTKNEKIVFAYGSDNKIVTLNAQDCEVIPE